MDARVLDEVVFTWNFFENVCACVDTNLACETCGAQTKVMKSDLDATYL